MHKTYPGVWFYIQFYFIKINLSSLSLELSVVNNFMSRDESLSPLSLLNSMFHLVWAWGGIVHVISHRVHMCNFPVIFWVYQRNCFLEVIPLSGSFVLSVPPSIIQSLICKVCDMGTQFRPEYSKTFHSLYIFLWWFFVILWLLIDFTAVAVVIVVWFFLKNSMFIFN